ncbi:MAG TPA: aspartate 1-decarboxylase [Fimbriimonadaceae bacterium]|nr:aspartate 1-decarboxylase [Fimbriimonadaceae bacterium]
MRLSQYLKAKLHHARVSYANPEYVGSVEIDRELMAHVGLEDGELVHVWAVDRDARIVTYAFGGPSGVVGLNGGAAHTFRVGERVIIAAFDLADEPIVPRAVLLDEENRVVREMMPFVREDRGALTTPPLHHSK